MLPTDLALITSVKNHVFPLLSLTKADHLAKVSGRYLERLGALGSQNCVFLFFVYGKEDPRTGAVVGSWIGWSTAFKKINDAEWN